MCFLTHKSSSQHLCLRYDPLRDRWRLIASMKTPRAKFGAVVKDNMVYVVGGKKGFRPKDQLRSMEVYSPDNNSWSELPTPMSMISGPSRATVVQDRV